MIDPTFPDHLIDAVTQAQAGLRFEEGGCFAMALALTEKLREVGADVTPALMSRETHAVVLMNDQPGIWVDHAGYSELEIDTEPTDEDGLRMAAARCGWSDEEFDSDLEWARDIIDLAIDMEKSGPAP